MTSNSSTIIIGNSSQRSSPSSYRLSGRRSLLNTLEATKKFKSEFCDSGIQSALNESSNASTNSIWTELLNSNAAKSKTIEDKTLRKRNLKEGYYNPPLGDTHHENFLGDAHPAPASSLTSPSTASVQSYESISELNLDCPEAAAEHEAVRAADWKGRLEGLERSKGIVCVDSSFEGEFLTFKCARDHTFVAKRSEEIVCPKCLAIMEKCSEYAKAHKGRTGVNGREVAVGRQRRVLALRVREQAHLEDQAQRLVPLPSS
eukprot:TRINITY_DN9448_c0_g2_i11.p1 TRINITY_DN9448_c0_g2~~TRINITY_DN9448_c0_g2_i11.p1  ORF type:complete len:260 (-),score=11.20 TRINITY_DN9448_c0_g2_i11:679-1458(-)